MYASKQIGFAIHVLGPFVFPIIMAFSMEDRQISRRFDIVAEAENYRLSCYKNASGINT
jgi:hypothetical protein